MFTSESVAAGHPDKMCDYISDSILDAYLAKDPNAKVACETCVKNNLCMVFGEVGSSEKLYYEEIVRNAIKEIGYDDLSVGMDYKSATVVVALDH
jgi:S-adenosylmethionine synthetase